MTKAESIARRREIQQVIESKFACLDHAIRAPFERNRGVNFPSFEEVALLMRRHRELRSQTRP